MSLPLSRRARWRRHDRGNAEAADCDLAFGFIKRHRTRETAADRADAACLLFRPRARVAFGILSAVRTMSLTGPLQDAGDGMAMGSETPGATRKGAFFFQYLFFFFFLAF